MPSVVTLASLLLLAPQSPPQESVTVVPAPSKCQPASGQFVLGEQVEVRFRGAESSALLEEQARLLADEVRLLTGVDLGATADAGAAKRATRTILLEQLASSGDSDAEAELGSYRLAVSPDEIRIEARSSRGIAHASATMLQLIAPTGSGFAVPALVIEDEPQHVYRTLMIDVARQPHGLGVLEDVIRLAGLYKLRFLHLHLTDDQLFTFPFPEVTDALENNTVYTREQLRGLVRYAEVRGITLLPEIDLPGHSRRLRESGYLEGAKNDRDVASAASFERVARLLGDVMDVFDSSPYFHIGGDESGAGEELLPFLGRVNRFVRSRGKRLVVWEGFHGAPTDTLPATGPDRVLVAAWESSYNPPWNLLEAGYSVINASWKPLYVVGSHNVVHPGSSGGRKWSPAQLARWRPSAFWHWEPGRPVFEDRGPNDPDRGDQTWDARWIGREKQILGAQMSVWEQRETSVIHDLRLRLPVFAERVWSGTSAPEADLLARVRAVDERVFGLVQPVAVTSLPDPSPIAALYEKVPADGVSLTSRVRVPGVIRYSLAPFRGSMHWLDWGRPADPVADGADFEAPIRESGGFALCARFVDASGRALPGTTWARFQGWPDRVRVREFEIGPRTPKVFPDFASMPERDSYRLPMLRGPIRHTRVVGQRFEATLQPPASGEFVVAMKTQSGRARLWLDENGNGSFDAPEEIIRETPSTEEPQSARVQLDPGRSYALRVDHISGLPRPVVIVTLEGPETGGRTDITNFLTVLED